MTEDETLEAIDNLMASACELDNLSGEAYAQALKRICDQTRSKYGQKFVPYVSQIATYRRMNTNNVNTGGGSITGSNIGGGTIWAQNITSINEVMQNSKNMDQSVKEAINSAVKFVETQSMEDDEREDATTRLKRITEQLEKPKGQEDKGIVQRSLDWLQATFSGATAIKGLYDTVTAYFS